jgi:hypothetical protein
MFSIEFDQLAGARRGPQRGSPAGVLGPPSLP